MDDLWGNAWGSPEEDAKPATWTFTEKHRNDDLQEDDLAMPSWSTGPGIRWDEPSDTHTSLWSNANANAYHTQDRPLENSYDDIALGNSHLAEPQGDTVELPVEPESHSSSPPSPQAQHDDITAPSPSREPDRELSSSPTPPSPSPSPSPSPEPSPSSSLDAFGTFTIGAEHSDTAPRPTIGGPLGGRVDDNEWGSPWGSVSKDAEEGSAQVASDEWESARLRQLEMDRRVPPELLSQIFLHLEELSKDAWPEAQDAAEEDWQSRWHSGMDVDGLDSLLLRYVPALTLPQLPPPGKSFTAKAMADAVKLSRNTGLAHTSPMSTLLAAKGSTAWETSVKSRTEMPVDEVPSGWRILEKDPKKDEKAGDKVKKSTGLLASFWSRRTASLSSNPPSQEQSNPSPGATAPENAHPGQTLIQRSSMESVKTSPLRVTTPQTPPQPSPGPAPSQDEDTNVPPPGSAVSRFLQRFSRPRVSSSSPRNSVTLSGDDLEYLSEVRSNSTDLVNIGDGLTGFATDGDTESTESGFRRGKLPPPLPPPPKVPAPAPLGNTLNGHSLISPNDPHLSTIPDLRNTPEDPTVSALTLLTPSPPNSPKLKSIHPNAALSHPLSPDKIAPSLIIPVSSSSRPNSVMSTPPVAQLQLQAPGNATKSFDVSQDDDDFSDFRSSPAEPPLFSLNLRSPVTRQGKVVSTQSSQRQLNSPFDDLVHLMSSPTTGPPNTFEAPKVLQPLNFANPLLPTAPTPPPPRESVSTHRASLDRPNATPTHSRTSSQQSTSSSKAAPTSPKQKAITQGHQRTQSLLDLAATRRGRWPAPPSPLPEPLQPPPPPPGKGQVESPTNADYFGFTPTDDSFNLSSPPAAPGKTPSSLLPPPQTDTSNKDSFPAPNLFDASPRPGPPSGGPPPLLSPTPHIGISAPARRTLSPPPLPTAIMNKSPTPKSSTPVPLLPPPSGFRLAASPAKAPPVPQIVPEPSPLTLLMDSGAGKVKVKATPPPLPPPPVKGTGGLSAQDLSFFEGL